MLVIAHLNPYSKAGKLPTYLNCIDIADCLLYGWFNPNQPAEYHHPILTNLCKVFSPTFFLQYT
jgi:hypothetical protein